MYKWKFPATFEEWDIISEQFQEALEEEQVEKSGTRKIMMALEELIPNIIEYGAKERTVTVELQLNIRREQERRYTEIIIEDDGVPFNPLSYGGNNVVTSTNHPAGGWGINMAKSLLDDIRYSYENGRNHLYIEKR